MAHALHPSHMAQAVFHGSRDRDEHRTEHPVAAVVAIATIVAVAVLIVWARLEVHGTADIEAALIAPVISEATAQPPRIDSRTEQEREHEAAVVANRWAGGLNQ